MPITRQVFSNPAAVNQIFLVLVKLLQDDKNLNIVKLIINKTGNTFIKYTNNESYTALHEACSYGSTQITQFLLEKGADVNAIDNEGRTPLHRAVERKHQTTVTELLKFNPKVNVLNYLKLAPLHIATLYELDAMKKLLIKSGANPKLKGIEGLDCKGLVANVRSGKLTLQPPPTLPKTTEADLKFHQGMSNAYKGILSEKGSANYFIEAINTLMGFFKSTTKEELQLYAIDVLKNINAVYDYHDSNKLYRFLVDYASSSMDYNFLAEINCSTAIKKLYLTDYVSAIHFMNEAYICLEKFPDAFSSSEEITILTNLTKAYQYINKNKFLLYSAKIEKLSPNDQDHLSTKFMVHFQNQNYELAHETLEKIQDPVQKTSLSKILLATNTPIAKEPAVKKAIIIESQDIPQSTSISVLSASMAEYSQQGNYLKAIETGKIILKYSKPTQIPLALAQILSVLDLAESWKEGLELINELYKDFPEVMENHTYPSLKYYECLFYCENANFELAFDSLNCLISNSELGAEISKVAYKSMQIFISAILKTANFDNIKLYFTKLFSAEAAEEIIKNQSKPVDDSATLSQETSVEPEEESYIDWVTTQPVELQEALSKLDYNKISAYYEKKKSIISQDKGNLVTPTSSDTSWRIEQEFFSEKDVCKIEDKPHFFAVITHDVYQSLEKKYQKQFTNALPKVVKGSGEGQTGNRFIQNKLVELKIHDGARLYTNTLYKNKNGDYLVRYNNLEKKHDNMPAIINNSMIDVINVDDSPIGNLFANTHDEVTSLGGESCLEQI